jgi:hypothetical protein
MTAPVEQPPQLERLSVNTPRSGARLTYFRFVRSSNARGLDLSGLRLLDVTAWPLGRPTKGSHREDRR